jgi:hypothetical protein
LLNSELLVLFTKVVWLLSTLEFEVILVEVALGFYVALRLVLLFIVEF